MRKAAWRMRARCVAVAAGLALGVLQVPAAAQHQHQPPQRSAEEWARILNDPARDAWQKPDEGIRALELKPGEAVADVGARAGYFARRFARVGATVYAVDIDPALVKIAVEGGPPNLIPVVAAPDDPRLPDGAVDTAFFCDVVHHIVERVAYYRKLARALKPGGRVVVIEFHKRPLPVGPPERMKLAQEEVAAECQAAGFHLERRLDILPYQYFLVFRR